MKKIRLGDVVSFSKGQQINGDELMKNGRYDYLNGGINPSGCWNDFNVTGDTVTISEGGNSCGYVNYMSYPFWCGAHCYYLYDSKLNNKYLYYALKSQQEKIMKLRTGACMPNIKKTDLGKFELNITTDINAQELTVFILDKITALIDKRKKQLKKLDELVKSRFVEMFGDPVANEKEWDTKTLLEMGSCKNGMNFHYEDAGVKINCLGVGDFKDYSIILDTSTLPTVSLNKMPSDDYMLRDNDIVFVRSNGNKALVGRSVAVYPGKVPTTFSGFCIRYRKTEKTVNVAYLLRVLKTESVRQKMVGRGANIQNLNQQILGTLIIPVPPIELQNQFADFVKQVDKSKFEIKQSLEKLELLKKALMQKYFG